MSKKRGSKSRSSEARKIVGYVTGGVESGARIKARGGGPGTKRGGKSLR